MNVKGLFVGACTIGLMVFSSVSLSQVYFYNPTGVVVTCSKPDSTDSPVTPQTANAKGYIMPYLVDNNVVGEWTCAYTLQFKIPNQPILKIPKETTVTVSATSGSVCMYYGVMSDLDLTFNFTTDMTCPDYN